MKLIPPNITPGPWKIDNAGVNVIDPSPSRNGFVLARCSESKLSSIAANTRAIAALPQCYQALASVWHLLRKTGDYSTQEYYQVSYALLDAGYKIEPQPTPCPDIV